MKQDAILEVGIDGMGRFYLVPATQKFPYIYREAMEVNWDEKTSRLYTPPPPRALLATSSWWFSQIVKAAKEQLCLLQLNNETKWHNIPDDVKAEIMSVQ